MSTDTIGDATDASAKLEQIAARLRDGETIEPVTARELLGWFGAKRRGLNIVSKIKGALYNHDLRTEPDFQFEYFDGPIEIKPGKNELDRSHVIVLEDFLDSADNPEISPSAEIVALNQLTMLPPLTLLIE